MRVTALRVVAFFVLFTGSLCHGQGITGTINGTVTDSTGAVIAGAKVSVQNLETNAVRTSITSSSGNYSVSQLPPGSYRERIESHSFNTYLQDQIVLEIGQTIENNATLHAGNESITVQVTSAPPVIQTEDSSVGLVINSNTIENTPLNGRLNIIGLLALAPGVQSSGAQDQVPVYGVTPAIGTSTRAATGFLGSTLDGVVNEIITLQRAEGEVPSLDAIQEFKVLTSGAPAEFQHPAEIVVVSKSGTNAFHGEVLEFNRVDATAAKSYYSTTKPPYQRNEFGGNFTGPIRIPGVYDGRNKAFFFAAYEKFLLKQSSPVNTAEPTVKERGGDFSEFTGKILDPLTGVQFPGNMIPSSRLNPVSQQLLKLYSLPTQSGYGTNAYELVPFEQNANRFSLRVDYKLSDKDQLRGTFLRGIYGPNSTAGQNSLAGGMKNIGENDISTVLGWTHLFSPTLLLDVWAQHLHLPVFRTPQNSGTAWDQIIPGLSPQLIEGAPQITITNLVSVGEQGSRDLVQTSALYGAVTKVLSKHEIKAGASFLFDNHWNQASVSPQRGKYSFTGKYSQGSQATISGQRWAVADFILGYPLNTQNVTPGTFITRNITEQIAGFIEDNWKATRRLTVNAGIRYDLQVFLDNHYGLESLYIPDLKQIVVFGNQYPAQAIPAYTTSTFPITLSSNLSNFPQHVMDYVGKPTKDFAPRLGFAFQAKQNTVIRGAAGIYYAFLMPTYAETGFSTLPFSGSNTFSNAVTGPPTFSMNNPFSATGAYSVNPNVNSSAKLSAPYAEQYNLAVEQQVAPGTSLRIGYVGQHSLKLGTYNGNGPNINASPAPIVGQSTQATNRVQPFNAIYLQNAPIFHSVLNSLQAGFHKQYAQGFSINAEYQWTKALGTESLENSSGVAPQDSYGELSGLARHVLVVNYIYDLPFGRGKKLGRSSGPMLDKLIGGWRISGVSTFQSGQPFSVLYTASSSPVGLVGGRADLIPGVPLYPANRSKTNWFNAAAFTAPSCYNTVTRGQNCQTVLTAGNAASVATYASYGNSEYNMLRGPNYQNWDANLQKLVKWSDRYTLQLRADAFNVFNHPNFGVPNSTITNTNVATITSTSSTPGYAPRLLQFGAEFRF